MVISTHLPPPVMMDSTAVRDAVTPHVVLQPGHMLLGRGFFREIPRQQPPELGNIANSVRLPTVLEQHRPAALMHFAAYAYVGESVEDPACAMVPFLGTVLG